MQEHKDIHEAVVAVMHEIGYVQKQKSPNLNYSYAGEAALIAALRPVMIDHGVYCYVSKIVPTRDTFTTAKGTAMNTTLSQGDVTFVHAKSGTSITVQAIGEGMDTGDKSANKSATGLLKYALRQTFLIETGDDPDGHESKPMERGNGKVKQEVTVTGKTEMTEQEKKQTVMDKYAELTKRGKAVNLNIPALDAGKTSEQMKAQYSEQKAFVVGAEEQAKAGK